MTELLAEIKDLRLIRNGDWCSFRIAWAEEFASTIKSFKVRVPIELREWDEDKKLWRVKLTPQTERMLGRVFDNFTSSLETARSQMGLWS